MLWAEAAILLQMILKYVVYKLVFLLISKLAALQLVEDILIDFHVKQLNVRVGISPPLKNVVTWLIDVIPFRETSHRYLLVSPNSYNFLVISERNERFWLLMRSAPIL